MSNKRGRDKRRRFTDAWVSRLKPPATGQKDHFDPGYPGLAFRITEKDVRSWAHFYRWGGKLVRKTLGRYPAMSLGEAREAWRLNGEKLDKGENPKAAPRTASPDTFAGVVDDWLNRDQSGKRTRAEVERIMRKEVLPTLGRLRIAEIGRRQIADLLDAIADRGAETLSRRCYSHLHRLYRWAVGVGIVEMSPMAHMPKRGTEVKRKRVLTEEELRRAWIAAGRIGWPMGSAFQLLMLSTARREQIGALRWSEIDEAGDVIHFIGADGRTKHGEDHDLPLSLAARALVGGLPLVEDSAFVFTTTGDTPISGWSKTKGEIDKAMGIVTDEKAEGFDSVRLWRIHDFRRTAATWLQSKGVGLQVVEALLGHIAGSRAGVVGVYQTHNYADEKREAIELWGEYLASLARKPRAGSTDEKVLGIAPATVAGATVG